MEECPGQADEIVAGGHLGEVAAAESRLAGAEGDKIRFESQLEDLMHFQQPVIDVIGLQLQAREQWI